MKTTIVVMLFVLSIVNIALLADNMRLNKLHKDARGHISKLNDLVWNVSEQYLMLKRNCITEIVQ
jgi:hypothetical protein